MTNMINFSQLLRSDLPTTFRLQWLCNVQCAVAFLTWLPFITTAALVVALMMQHQGIKLIDVKMLFTFYVLVIF